MILLIQLEIKKEGNYEISNSIDSTDSNIVNPYSAQNKVTDSAKDKPNESKQPSKISAAKAFMCLGATAAAVAGVLLAKKHISGKSLKAVTEGMHRLHTGIRNTASDSDVVEHFGKNRLKSCVPRRINYSGPNS